MSVPPLRRKVTLEGGVEGKIMKSLFVFIRKSGKDVLFLYINEREQKKIRKRKVNEENF